MKWETQLYLVLLMALIVNTYVSYERIKSTERLIGTNTVIQKILERSAPSTPTEGTSP